MKTYIVALAVMSTLMVNPASSTEFNFMHFWKAEGEKRAVNSLRQTMLSADLKLEEYVVTDNFTGIRAALMEQLLSENPPNATQWIIGDELGELIGSNIMQPIYSDDVNFKDVLLPEIYELSVYQDGLTNIPLGIHTQNFMVLNKDVYEKLNLKLPKTWQDMLDTAPAFSEAGITPFAMSGQIWQMRVLFQSVLSSLMNAKEYEGFVNQKVTDDRARNALIEAFRILIELKKYLPEDSVDMRFQLGSQKVSTGEAAAFALGDYIVSELDLDANLVCGPVPGANLLIWGVDGMAFVAKNYPEIKGGVQTFIRKMYLEGGTRDYIKYKGGISVLKEDVHSNISTDPCNASINEAWNNFEHRVWLNGDSWQSNLRVLGNVASEYIFSEKTDPVEAADYLLSVLSDM